jgi:hypothetical protein
MDPTVAAVAKNSKIALQWNNVAISSILDSLTMTTIDVEPTGENAKTKTTFCAYCYYIEENNLVVSLNPSNLGSVITSLDVLKLYYVQSAYRYGPVIHVKAMFDPRIHQDVTIVMSATNLSGKKVAGKLVPLLSTFGANMVQFRPVGGINFVFSTNGENYMTFQGCV